MGWHWSPAGLVGGRDSPRWAKLIGLVLAAGAGTRYGRPKAGVMVSGERLVDRAVRVLSAGGASEVVVVLGAQVLDVPDSVVVINRDWRSGMASSLRCGLAACTGRPGQSAAITLVDLPGLTPELIRRLGREEPSALCVATYDGRQGHPVVVGRERWAEMAAAAVGDAGARSYLAAHRDEIEFVEVADLGNGEDLDEPRQTRE